MNTIKSALHEMGADAFQTIKDCAQVERELASAKEAGNIAMIPPEVSVLLSEMQQIQKAMYVKLKKTEAEVEKKSNPVL